jgi:hypothetical protein
MDVGRVVRHDQLLATENAQSAIAAGMAEEISAIFAGPKIMEASGEIAYAASLQRRSAAAIAATSNAPPAKYTRPVRPAMQLCPSVSLGMAMVT